MQKGWAVLDLNPLFYHDLTNRDEQVRAWLTSKSDVVVSDIAGKAHDGLRAEFRLADESAGDSIPYSSQP